MREIEKKIIECLERQENKTLSKMDRVENSIYYLWDSPIVEIKNNCILISFCGFYTNIIKQRIRNILYYFCKINVFQKNFEIYVNNEKVDINDTYCFLIKK